MHQEQQQSHRRLGMATASAPGTSSSACAACRVLRRKCTTQCLFAPHFPPDQPQKFAHVHKVFGVANVTKMLHELPPPHREDCVNSLAYEADARVQDPVYGCVGSISVLQHQLPFCLDSNENSAASPRVGTRISVVARATSYHSASTSSSPSERLVTEHHSESPSLLCSSSKVAHLQAQLALATSEITKLRETFVITAAAAASTATDNSAAAVDPDSRALLMAALLPCSHSPPTDPISVNLAAAVTPATPEELPQPPPVLASIVSRQLSSPISCEHSPPLLPL